MGEILDDGSHRAYLGSRAFFLSKKSGRQFLDQVFFVHLLSDDAKIENVLSLSKI